MLLMSTRHTTTVVTSVSPYAAALPFPPLGTTWVEAAEGETKPIITTARRVDSCSIEIQVVGINKGYGYT